MGSKQASVVNLRHFNAKRFSHNLNVILILLAFTEINVAAGKWDPECAAVRQLCTELWSLRLFHNYSRLWAHIMALEIFEWGLEWDSFWMKMTAFIMPVFLLGMHQFSHTDSHIWTQVITWIDTAIYLLFWLRAVFIKEEEDKLVYKRNVWLQHLKWIHLELKALVNLQKIGQQNLINLFSSISALGCEDLLLFSNLYHCK